MFLFEFVLVAVIGLILGSFATALSFRVPRKMKWGAVRSACPSCQNPLGVAQLVPVFSWVLSKGRCHFCKCKISIRYPLIEVASAALCLGVLFAYGFTLHMFVLLAAIPVLMSLFIIDLERMILPNQLVFILIILAVVRLIVLFLDSGGDDAGIFWAHFSSGLLYAAVSFFIGFVLSRVLKKDALGMGDVKFFFAAGLWLGGAALPYFMIISGVFGVVIALLYKRFFKIDVFPFGPALILSFYVLLMYQGPLLWV